MLSKLHDKTLRKLPILPQWVVRRIRQVQIRAFIISPGAAEDLARTTFTWIDKADDRSFPISDWLQITSEPYLNTVCATLEALAHHYRTIETPFLDHPLPERLNHDVAGASSYLVELLAEHPDIQPSWIDVALYRAKQTGLAIPPNLYDSHLWNIVGDELVRAACDLSQPPELRFDPTPQSALLTSTLYLCGIYPSRGELSALMNGTRRRQ